MDEKWRWNDTEAITSIKITPVNRWYKRIWFWLTVRHLTWGETRYRGKFGPGTSVKIYGIPSEGDPCSTSE